MHDPIARLIKGQVDGQDTAGEGIRQKGGTRFAEQLACS